MSLSGTFGLRFFLSFFFAFWTHAQTSYSLKAKASGEYPYVYQSPDFNAPILTELERGKVYFLSSKKVANYFYKVFVKPGLEGYVSDVEVEVQAAVSSRDNTPTTKTQNKKRFNALKKKDRFSKVQTSKPSKPFYMQKYRGLSLESIQYTEDTMGSVRSAPLTFIGFRMSGYDTLVSG
ncbi:MAG: hypothetical protein L6Q37_14010, partial [Bdellovibrionaceae bacterium]|nr:hypothetical protein [Pseudobdellovibrionaceae bacterium]